MGVYFCGGFVYIAVDVSRLGDYEKLIILGIIAEVRSQESYQFRLHRNDGEWGVGSGESGNVELLTLILSFPYNQKRY